MDTGTFQLVLKVAFGVLCAIGFASFGLYGVLGGNGNTNGPKQNPVDIHIWGTINNGEIEGIIESLSAQKHQNKPYARVIYTPKNPATFRRDYVEAIAVRKQPDLLLLDHTTILEIEETLQVMPFLIFPRSAYERTFVPDSNVFIRPDGYIAMPFFLDTMVLYYNENLRRRKRVRSVPELWEDILSEEYHPFNRRNARDGRALIPLGAYNNYDNAHALLTALVLQQQSENTADNNTFSTALQFYTSFADARSKSYFWSTTLQDAYDMFVGDKLLLYPGFVSEFHDLRRSNPNLTVRVAPLPRISRESLDITPAVFYAFTIPRTTQHPRFDAVSELIVDLLGIFHKTVCTAPNGSEYPDGVCPAGAQQSIVPKQDLYKTFSLLPALRKYHVDDRASETERSIAESLLGARNIPLSREGRETLLQTIRNVVTGAESVKDGARTLQGLF